MKFVDVRDLKNRTSLVISYLEEEDVVVTRRGEPIALIQKFNNSIRNNLSKELVGELVKSDENIATQYAAMMAVWGDPHCDIYDEAFRDE